MICAADKCFLLQHPYNKRCLFHSAKNLSDKKRKAALATFLPGGEGEIRTLEPFLAVTRFPVVRPRPTRRLLQKIFSAALPRFDSLPQKKLQVNSFMQFSEFIFINFRFFDFSPYILAKCIKEQAYFLHANPRVFSPKLIKVG